MSWLLSAAVILIVCRLGGIAARRLGQPFIVGELLAGLALGPAFFATVAPEIYHQVLTPANLQSVHAIGSIAISVFMFDVGWHMRSGGDQVHHRTAVKVGVPSFVVPAITGAAFALAAPDSWLPPGADRAAFVVLVACAFGVTAMPVLALLLRSLGVEESTIGRLALGVASGGDIVAWALLLVAVALQGRGDSSELVRPLLLVCVVAAVAGILALRRVRLTLSNRPLSEATTVTAMVVVGLLSATLFELAGLHAALGALVGGLLWPGRAETDRRAIGVVSVITTHVLLPFYLADIGAMFAPYSLGHEPLTLALTAGLCVVAVLTKLVGTSIGARLAGMDRWDGYALGALLGARGVTEIMVLGVALAAGIISRTAFDIGVVVTVATTVFAGPAFRWITAAAARRVPQAEPLAQSPP